MIKWRKKFGGSYYSNVARQTKLFWKVVKGNKVEGKINALMDLKDRVLYSDKFNIARILVSHCKTLFGGVGTAASTVEGEGWTDERIDERVLKAFSLENVSRIKRKLKSNTSPGPDKVTYDMLKLTGKNFDKVIHSLFCRILKENQWPTPFFCSSLKSVFKKGRTELMGNYRGITLSPTIGKWWTLVLYSALQVHFVNKGVFKIVV